MTRTRIDTQNIDKIINFITSLAGLLTGAPIEIVFQTYGKGGDGLYKKEKIKSLNEAIEKFLEFCNMHGDHAYLSYADFYHVDAYEGIDEDGCPFEVTAGDSINIGFDEMVKFRGWELALYGYEEGDKIDYKKQKPTLISINGEEIPCEYHSRGIYSTHSVRVYKDNIWYKGKPYIVCYDSDSPNYIGKRIVANHAIGFYSDEDRDILQMFKYLLEHPEYPICASLRTQKVFGKAHVLVEGDVVDAFRHNVFSITSKGKRVCDVLNEYADRMYEEYFDEEVKEADNWKSGYFNEIWLQNTKVIAVYDDSDPRVIKEAKRKGIPIIEMPKWVSTCQCP